MLTSPSTGGALNGDNGNWAVLVIPLVDRYGLAHDDNSLM